MVKVSRSQQDNNSRKTYSHTERKSRDEGMVVVASEGADVELPPPRRPEKSGSTRGLTDARQHAPAMSAWALRSLLCLAGDFEHPGSTSQSS